MGANRTFLMEKVNVAFKFSGVRSIIFNFISFQFFQSALVNSSSKKLVNPIKVVAIAT